ncbi:hypothetical protein KIL84_001299 [Mauremys mutica]|uniref:Uncharacterized protein n=1 Tax=Mauremys mutica TaxID=74926 RepID=A0A9D3WY92_9SAUR|nr:hypothetical protein KIL84_001299 [Mauremys mutica]
MMEKDVGTPYTPAEHLHQLRKLLRRCKEDMFWEVLQSSVATEQEQRAWRESANEDFKIDRQERKESQEILVVQEQMIKVMEVQTEMLQSLITASK